MSYIVFFMLDIQQCLLILFRMGQMLWHEIEIKTNVAHLALIKGYKSKLGKCTVSKPTCTLSFASWPWQNIYGCHGQYSVLRILEKFHIDG